MNLPLSISGAEAIREPKRSRNSGDGDYFWDQGYHGWQWGGKDLDLDCDQDFDRDWHSMAQRLIERLQRSSAMSQYCQ